MTGFRRVMNNKRLFFLFFNIYIIKNLIKKSMKRVISTVIFTFCILPSSIANACPYTYHLPSMNGRFIASDMESFRTLSEGQAQKIIADKFCQEKEWDKSIDWGTVFFQWKQRRSLWRVKEIYSTSISSQWIEYEGGRMFSSITCSR
ncbi:MAG: hypothetical protein F6K55_08690 [Moorea sp. SIO4A3]|nr:hypothetical protein [Moorena sp. SIO4A3]